MNSINRLLTAIKSLFSKRGNNVEGNETTAEALPAANMTAESSAVGPETAPAISSETSAPPADSAFIPEVAQPATAPAEVISHDPVVMNADSSSISAGLLTDVKTLLKVAGHDVEAVWDDAVAYAQKVATEEAALAEKLVSVLRVAGHDVVDIISDAFSFARKHGKS